MPGTRTELAALTAAFDWDKYHDEFDAGLSNLARAINELRECEEALHRANRELARDLERDLAAIREALL